MPTALSTSVTDKSAINAVAWATLAKAASKESNRDDLASGSSHTVNLKIDGDVDGTPFDQSLSAVITVGRDSVRAINATPSVSHVIASILAKLNSTMRKVILRNLPEEFERAGCALPQVPNTLVNETDQILKRLRAKRQIPVQDTATCMYELNADHLSIVG